MQRVDYTVLYGLFGEGKYMHIIVCRTLQLCHLDSDLLYLNIESFEDLCDFDVAKGLICEFKSREDMKLFDKKARIVSYVFKKIINPTVATLEAIRAIEEFLANMKYLEVCIPVNPPPEPCPVSEKGLNYDYKCEFCGTKTTITYSCTSCTVPKYETDKPCC